MPITQLLRNQHPSPQPPHALRAALEELGSRLGAPSAVGPAMREAWRRGALLACRGLTRCFVLSIIRCRSFWVPRLWVRAPAPVSIPADESREPALEVFLDVAMVGEGQILGTGPVVCVVALFDPVWLASLVLVHIFVF